MNLINIHQHIVKVFSFGVFNGKSEYSEEPKQSVSPFKLKYCQHYTFATLKISSWIIYCKIKLIEFSALKQMERET